MGIFHRTVVPFIAGLLVVLVTAPPAYARRAIALKFPRFEVPPHSDREACIFVRLPRDEPMDIGGTLIVHKGVKQDFVSHHFLMWAYLGDHAADFPDKSQLQNGEACLDFGPSDRDRRILIAGSQSVRQRLPIAAGLAQRLHPVDENGRKVVGLILNSHWINSSDRMQHGSVKIKVLPNKGTPKRFIEPIFDVIANSAIGVPPKDLDSAPPAGLAPGERESSWSWGPRTLNLAGPLGGGRVPDGPACIVLLSAHMHKRGEFFSIDFVDGATSERLFQTPSYSDPGLALFNGIAGNPPPRLIKPGQLLRYTCKHDNGNTTDVKLGCEEHFPEEGRACVADSECSKRGMCIDGICKNLPGTRIIDLPLDQVLSGAKVSGAARRCATDGDCPAGPDPDDPDRTFTGRCVPARLVFGFTSDDDMCILPGAYYDAVEGAPPGRECDLSLL